MVIETERLRLRKFTETDITPFMEYHNDLSWMQFQNFKGKSRAVCRKKLLKPFDLEEGSQVVVELKEKALLIGDVFLKKEDNQTLMIGYSINSTYQRMGYMSEAVRALIQYAFSQGIDIILACTDPLNEKSIHFLRKLGFSLVQEEKDNLTFQRVNKDEAK